jgi:hypothetical protein
MHNQKDIIVNLDKGTVVARNGNKQCISLDSFRAGLQGLDNAAIKRVVYDTAMEAAYVAVDKGIVEARKVLMRELKLSFFVGVKGK